MLRHFFSPVGFFTGAPPEAAKISREKGKLAQQYVRAKNYRKAAELYQEIAPLDPTTHAWNLKESATAWLTLDNEECALRPTLAAESALAEARNDQLTRFSERNLASLSWRSVSRKRPFPTQA